MTKDKIETAVEALIEAKQEKERAYNHYKDTYGFTVGGFASRAELDDEVKMKRAEERYKGLLRLLDLDALQAALQDHKEVDVEALKADIILYNGEEPPEWFDCIDYLKGSGYLRTALTAHTDTNTAIRELAEALYDCAQGLRYVREHYGDLCGVGFDRADQAYMNAMTNHAATIHSAKESE